MTAYRAAMNGITGANVACHLDGTFHLLLAENFPQYHDGIVGWLQNIQRYVHLTPFEQWGPDMLGPVLDVEALIDLRRDPRLLGEKTENFKTVLATELEEAKQRLLTKTPAPLRKWMEESVLVAANQRTVRNRDWMVVEHALDAMTDNMAAAGVSLPDSNQRRQQQHWSEIACGMHDDDPANWAMTTMTRGGNSLWLTLLYSDRQPGNAQRLRDVLGKVGQETLRAWCLEPDADGYTLPLRLVHRSLKEYRYQQGLGLNELIELPNVMRWLIHQVGWEVVAQGLVSEQRSVLGLLLETPGHEFFDQCEEEALTRFLALTDVLDDHDLPWADTLVWREPEATDRQKSVAAAREVQCERQSVRIYERLQKYRDGRAPNADIEPLNILLSKMEKRVLLDAQGAMVAASPKRQRL